MRGRRVAVAIGHSPSPISRNFSATTSEELAAPMAREGTRSLANNIRYSLRLAAEMTAGPAKFYGAAPRLQLSSRLSQ